MHFVNSYKIEYNALDLKLKQLDLAFDSKRIETDKLSSSDVEDRLIHYQKKLELKMKMEMDQQLTRYKEFELAQVRLDERKSFQSETTRLKMDYEKKIQEMQSSMIFLEEREAKRWACREQEMEIANIEMRQKILDETNRLNLKEASLRHEVELQMKELQMERDILERKYKEAEQRIHELTDFKEKYSRQMQETMAQYKIDLNREHAGLISSVEVEKTRLEGTFCCLVLCIYV